MIYPKITDQDEWNYLDSLEDSDLVGFPNSTNQGYYARVLLHKYSQCQGVKLTATTFQVLQRGISEVPVEFTSEQYTRQRHFDALDHPDLPGAITKLIWLQVLADENLFPNF